MWAKMEKSTDTHVSGNFSHHFWVLKYGCPGFSLINMYNHQLSKALRATPGAPMKKTSPVKGWSLFQ
jgi:hypothetical protein